jgi:hypothetical protein
LGDQNLQRLTVRFTYKDWGRLFWVNTGKDAGRKWRYHRADRQHLSEAEMKPNSAIETDDKVWLTMITFKYNSSVLLSGPDHWIPSGLRIGELLKIKVSDISDRTITLREPKSGKESELACMLESVSKKLAEYIKDKALRSDVHPFPISYSTARALVRRLGETVNVRISPHDLRSNSATYASRNGVPLEVVSKVILRHQDLKTTQVYLGKINDTEAIRWMDILHAK